MKTDFFKTLLFLLILFIGIPNHIKAQLSVDFKADTTFGCGALANVSFTDLSTGNISSWLWDFGNGNISPLQNPVVNFPSIGQYTISLTISDGTNSLTETKTAYINVYTNPNASIAVTSATSGCPPLSVTFNSNSTAGNGNITQYIWDFGDGSPAGSSSNITHTYLTGGTYNPSLQVIDQFGCTDNDVFNSISVTPAPQARFTTSNSRVGCTVPLTVNFVDNSIGNNLTYLWDFGDGFTSPQQNPSHTYTTLGNYNVSLKVTDPNCSDTRVRNNYVRVNNVNVSFSSIDTICLGAPFNPTNLSTGTTIYRWDFGDGNSSTDVNPTHLYDSAGWYTIRLTGSSGSVCLGSYTDSVFVVKMTVNPILNDTFFCDVSDKVKLSFTSQYVDDFYWKLAGNYFDSSIANPVEFNPAIDGIFNDTLIISSQLGCIDTITSIPSRRTHILQAQFQNQTHDNCIPFIYSPSIVSNGADSIISWQWDFGHFGQATQETPNPFNVDTVGNFPVTLVIGSQKGCTDIITTQIKAGKKHQFSFILPNDTICRDDSVYIQHISPSKDSVDYLIYSANSYLTGTNYLDSISPYYFTNFRNSGLHSISVKAIDHECVSDSIVDTTFYVRGPFVYFSYLGNCQNRLSLSFNSFFEGSNKFYWDFGDGTIDSSNSSPTHLYNDTGKYLVTLTAKDTSGICYDHVYSQEIYIRPASNITPSFTRNSICLGDTIESMFSDIGRDAYWLMLEDTLRSDSSVSFTFDSSGYYNIDFHFVDNLGCKFNYQEKIFVSEIKADFSILKKDSCIPSEVVFESLSTSDTTITSYYWNFGNGNTSILPVDSIIYTTANNYDISLIVTDAIGCQDSLRIDNAFETDFLTVDFQTSKTVLCEGESTFFINTSKGRIDSVFWDFGDGNSGTGRTPTHFYNSTGLFDVSLTIIDSLGCKQTLAKTNHINVQPKPIADFTSDTAISSCYPLPVIFEDLTAPVPTKWNWQFGDNASSVFQDPFHNYTLPGNYDVTLAVETSAGCKDTIIKTAYIQTSGPVARFSINKDTACLNENIVFEMTNQQGVSDFTWDFGDGVTSKSNPATHAYTSKTGEIFPSLIISNSSGSCVVPLKDTLYIENVKADFLVDSINCGIPANLNFTNVSLGASTNLWSIDGSNFNIVNANYTFNQAGFYNIKLNITSTIGCSDFEEKTIKIIDNPTANVVSDTGLCIGDSILLVANGGNTYEWTPNYNILDANKPIATVFPDTTTTYYIKVYNQDGCFDLDSVKVIVPEYNGPNSIEDTTLYIGEKWAFYILNEEGLNYNWTPSNGLSCADCPNPIISPLETTTYTLNITDNFGCISESIVFTVEVLDLFSVDVPTAFTPNGDQINDIIFVDGWGIKSLNYFRIYNRFGELVFESNSKDEGWNGMYKGKLQASDTYVYTVEAVSYSGETLVKEGNFSLLR